MSWPPRLARWRTIVEEEAEAVSLSPTILAAVMDRESAGDAEVVGSDGHGYGLMQIDDRYHPDFFEDPEAWKDPVQNIREGAAILANNLKELNSVAGAVAAYNASLARVRRVLETVGEDVPSLDKLTTGRNYVSWVLDRAASLQGVELEG